VKLAERLSKLGMPTTALRWANEAMEQDNTLRKKSVLALGFPNNWKDIFVKEAARNNIQPRLLMSLTRQESAFNPRAVSTSNAAGLMQLIPPTAREVAKKLGYKSLDIPEDLFYPETNIPMGSFYITDMLKQYSNSVPFALAAYNAGPARMNLWIKSRGDVQDLVTRPSSEPADEIWFDELPWNETSFYVKAILRNTLLYRLLDEGNYDLGPVVWADLVDKKPVTQ
jgi:soluble lytic murein transglycosylase